MAELHDLVWVEGLVQGVFAAKKGVLEQRAVLPVQDIEDLEMDGHLPRTVAGGVDTPEQRAELGHPLGVRRGQDAVEDHAIVTRPLGDPGGDLGEVRGEVEAALRPQGDAATLDKGRDAESFPPDLEDVAG